MKKEMQQLNEQEANIYYSSDWYKNQMKTKRENLIKKGIIVRPSWHENTPTYVKYKGVKSV